MVKNLPVVQETWVQSLSWEDPLEKPMATHSSIVSQKISWTEESGELQSVGSQRVGHGCARAHTHTHPHTHPTPPPPPTHTQASMGCLYPAVCEELLNKFYNET